MGGGCACSTGAGPLHGGGGTASTCLPCRERDGERTRNSRVPSRSSLNTTHTHRATSAPASRHFHFFIHKKTLGCVAKKIKKRVFFCLIAYLRRGKSRSSQHGGFNGGDALLHETLHRSCSDVCSGKGRWWCVAYRSVSQITEGKAGARTRINNLSLCFFIPH